MATALWTSEEAQRATGGVAHGAAWVAQGVSIDTRTLAAGDVFVALRGERVDGHAYLGKAAAMGAAVALVDHVPADAPAGLPLLVVPDVLKGLEDLARAARARSAARVVGVTGSVGKTSAKEALALALAAYGRVHATAGNYNNHIGLPLTLARMPTDTEFAVLEMGMNHAREIAPLSAIAQPDVALITTVEAVHIENFADGMAGIARAKGEILEGLRAGGVAVLNADNPHTPTLRAVAAEKGVERILCFGTSEGADVRVREVTLGVEGTRVALDVQGQEVALRVGAIGAHWGVAMAGVLGCVAALGLPLERAVAALEQFREPVGRGRLSSARIGGAQVALLDDSYNASPVSMRAAIEKLGMLAATAQPPRRAIAVLGQMLELGEQAPQWHAELAEVLVRAGVAQVFACGALMEHLAAALPAEMLGGFAPDAQALRGLVEKSVREGDIVLVKGSHGSKVYQLIEAWA